MMSTYIYIYITVNARLSEVIKRGILNIEIINIRLTWVKRHLLDI